MTWLGWLSVWLCGLIAGGLSGAAAAYLLVRKAHFAPGAHPGGTELPSRPAVDRSESLDPRVRAEVLLGLKRGEDSESVAAAAGLSGAEMTLLKKVTDLAAFRR